MLDTAIITIDDYTNYGNRLQNYALQRVLSLYGRTCTLQCPINSESILKYKAQHSSLARVLCLIKKDKIRAARISRCRKFDKSVNVKGPFVTLQNCDEASRHYNKIVIGSDQVWNYRWIDLPTLEFRLGLGVPKAKLVTYAASIGLDSIDSAVRDTFRRALSRIQSVSVREDRAADLVEELGCPRPTVVLDPTLLINPSEWREVTTNFVRSDECYVLGYFLGSPTDRQRRVIEGVAQTFGCRVRMLNEPEDRETLKAGPQDFVELISKALYVFTDSYHACCFSILFNRPFKVFNRVGCEGNASMNSRMRTLFRLFELEDLMGDESAMPQFDWGGINRLLELHRAGSMAWLESALAEVASK